jgi:polyphenol oxidase
VTSAASARPAAGLLAERMDPSAAAVLSPLAGSVPLLAVRLPGRLRAAFTTRVGGVSGFAYQSLNLTEKTGDRPAAVRQNRLRLLAALPGAAPGAAPLTIVVPRQEHTTRVVGAREWSLQPEGPCDGLTLQPGLDEGLAALLLFADCLPVLLVSDSDMAAVHAGWRGLLAGVIQQAARAMTAPPGLAVLGPGIGPCCYEVGADLGEAFTRRYGTGLLHGSRLDLKAAAQRALAEVGLPSSRVVDSGLCTFCQADLFYSHRRDGAVTGRHGLIAWLTPPTQPSTASVEGRSTGATRKGEES